MLPRAPLLWMTWCVALLWSTAALTQPYPSRPVTLVVPYAAGSGVDILARILMAKLGQRLGQPIIVEAKPGAGSAIGTDFVAKSVPNGYILMLTTNVLPVLPALYRSVPFSPVSDFSHISKVATGSMALVVNPTVLPIKSLDELVARARAEPGKLNYGSAGNGTPHHLGMELLKHQLGLNIVHIPYKGATGALNDLLGGQVPLAMFPVNVVVRKGRQALGDRRVGQGTLHSRAGSAEFRRTGAEEPRHRRLLLYLGPCETPAGNHGKAQFGNHQYAK
jgi:tripartite-type tricarboxylate transporter receptor subunit TctC